MLNTIKIATVAAGLALASGCFTMNADLPGTLRADVTTEQTEKVGSFAVEKGHTFYICGLVGAPGPEFFQAEIAREVQSKGGDGAANVQYEAQSTCGDLACSFFSLNIITPRTYKLSGDVVKIRKEALPGVAPAVAPAPTPAPTAMTTTTDAPKVAQSY